MAIVYSATICLVCAAPATVQKGRNGIPAGTPLCASCVAAVSRRELGIVRRPDGATQVDDGREIAREAVA